MSGSIEIQGECAARFCAVKDAFASSFEEGLEVGASFCAFHEGEKVVDLWGGHADAARTRPWERDTLVNVWSTTKMMAALTTLLLVDRGALDPDAPVADYWPEFAANGKEHLPVRMLMAHTSGLAGWTEPLTVQDVCDWEKSTGLLAAQAPLWEPGSQSGYHALTHGHLMGEVVRRVDGRSIGRVFAEEIAGPLGADFHIGLADEHHGRVAEVIPPPEGLGQGAEVDRESVAFRVLSNPPLSGAVANDPAWRRAEIPAANGHGNARAVATVAGAVANGELLSSATLDRAVAEESFTPDAILGVPIRFGLGFGLTSKLMPIGPNPRTFFWGGWGGSLVVVDPDARLGFSYVMNKMGRTTLGDPRGFRPGAAILAAAT